MSSLCCSGAVWSGHCSSGSFRNSGPFIHLPISCITCNPRHTWSATFSSPGMCFHWLGSELFWISPTLAETNGLKLREGLWNQARVILLSVKNLTSANWIVHSFSIVIARQKARKAAGVEFWVALGAGCHSRLSCNEVYFIGALFRFFWRMYAQAPNASYGASEKTHVTGNFGVSGGTSISWSQSF